jgi:phage-related baseplate assembly protein|nr:MAG TPA: baseplate assembly protein V [Caudoviricetes sp.]
MSADNNRRIESIIRFGLIAEVDYAQAKARVKCGEILTDFIPFITMRSGTTKTWSPPTQGEQCVILAASGELTTACIITGLYTQNSPSHSADEHVIEFADGAKITYNQSSGALVVTGIKTASITAANQIDIDCPTINIKGNMNIDGKVTSTGDMIAGGISQMKHKHKDVSKGKDKTGEPE